MFCYCQSVVSVIRQENDRRNRMYLLLLSAATCKRRKKKQQQQQSFYLSTTSLKTNMAGGIGQWYWNAAPNPFGKDQPAQWIAYSSNDNKTIEDSFIKKATKVELENHCIYFHERMQVHKQDFNRQRPIKREEKK
ncbi:unnamed protein product [Rotaria socialis]|uniref:WWE domain-containing protein n=2 Tax=Rotaria socialis TaxID=392032 RepID=A0A818FVJ3_9BILA|nr:unnamed protein product [Rotaria socialis]